MKAGRKTQWPTRQISENQEGREEKSQTEGTTNRTNLTNGEGVKTH